MNPSLPPLTPGIGVSDETNQQRLIRFKRIQADGRQYLMLHETDEEIRESYLRRMLNAEQIDQVECKDLVVFFNDNYMHKNLHESGIKKVLCTRAILRRPTLAFFCQEDGELKHITLNQLFEKIGEDNLLVFN